MNHPRRSAQRVNDTLFALVLAVSAASSAFLAASAGDLMQAPLAAASAPVQLERVVVTARRETATLAAAAMQNVELPRVVVSTERSLAAPGLARAGTLDSNS